MSEDTIPGSRVTATTKHGTLNVDDLAAIQPGMARLMDELSRRFWVLYFAAKEGNWELAEYMEHESDKLLEAMGTVRPKYRDDLAAFRAESLAPIRDAVRARNWTAFDSAYRSAVSSSDVYHAKYRKAFIRFRIPDRPPDWFDLGPR